MGPSVSFPLPLTIAQKLPIRNSWELIIKKLPIPLPILYYFELKLGSISEHTVLLLPGYRKKSTKIITFWVRRPPGGVGVFHAKGWWPKTSCSLSLSLSKACLPWVSKRGIWDVPGILLGCPGPLGVFQKFVLKKFVRIFRSLLLPGYSYNYRTDSRETCFLHVPLFPMVQIHQGQLYKYLLGG